MSTKAEGKVAVAAPPPIPPRIPESLVSVPDQRFYALALLGGLQAYKLSDAVFNFVQSLRPATAPVPSTFLNPLVLLQWLPFVPNAEAGVSAYLTKWTALDSAALLLLLGLRIPGLRFGKGRFFAYMIVAWVIDALVFGKFEVSPSSPLQTISKPCQRFFTTWLELLPSLHPVSVPPTVPNRLVAHPSLQSSRAPVAG